MRNGYAVVDTRSGVPEAYSIVSRHRTREAAEAVIEGEIRRTNKAMRQRAGSNIEYGSHLRVFLLRDGALAGPIGYVGILI